jgi:MFS family permease
MVGRVFVGLGVGFGLAVSYSTVRALFFFQNRRLTLSLFLFAFQLDPLYIAEISPAARRGELVTWSEIALNVGIVFGFSSGLIFGNLEDSVSWRYMFAMGAILPIVMIFLALCVMPESPRWLVSKGRDDKAIKILQQIYGDGK